ncbi:unnamed protein product [Fusarium graminearum]|nr:unnamed protein product [Fusarium graminearum]
MSPFSWHSRALLFVLTFLSWTWPGINACHVHTLGLGSNQCYLDTRYHLPTVVVLATGGTISGEGDSPTDTTHYRAGAVHIDDILHEIKHEFEHNVHVITHQILGLDSINYNSSHLILLRHTIEYYLSQPNIHAVVIATGSSSLPDVFTFLDHTVLTKKTVVLAAAFKPNSAYGADGPGILLAAVLVEAFTAYMGIRAEKFERTITEVAGIVLESFDHGYWPDASREVIERGIAKNGIFVVVVARDTSFRVDHDRVDGAAAGNQWSLRSTVNLLSVILALNLDKNETKDIINNPWLSA